MSSQTPYRDTLVMHFFGDLLHRTMDAPTAAAHQQALQGFLEDLSPWVLPHELPTLLGPAFTLFDACEFTPTADGTDEDVAVALSPQGEVIFRAWLPATRGKPHAVQFVSARSVHFEETQVLSVRRCGVHFEETPITRGSVRYPPPPRR